MKKMKVYSEKRKEWLMKDVKMTGNFLERFLGLMGKSHIGAEALLISPCNSIHMFFMRMPIDAVFLDSEGRVLAVKKGMKPWTISRIYKKGHSVLEMPLGGAERAGIEVGEKISFSEVNADA